MSGSWQGAFPFGSVLFLLSEPDKKPHGEGGIKE